MTTEPVGASGETTDALPLPPLEADASSQVTPPVESEALPPAPPAEPPAPSAEAQELTRLRQAHEAVQREMAVLRQQASQQAVREATAQDNAALLQYRAQLEARGYDATAVQELVGERAQLFAQRRQDQQARLAFQQQAQQAEAMAQAKELVIQHISAKYGMSANELRQYNDPYLMEAKAEAWQMRQELAKLRQGPARAQTMASTAPGAPVATPDNIDKLWLDFEKRNMGKPNPYDQTYRVFQETGRMA